MLTKIANIAKWIGGVIGAGMAVVGVYTLIFGLGAKSAIEANNDTEFKTKTITTLNKLVQSDSLKNIKLDEVIENQYTQQQSLKALNSSYVNLLKGSGKVDELIKYLESTQFELKKKNGSGELLIPFSTIN